MSYRLFTVPAFDKVVKRLRKKYRRIKFDLQRLTVELADNPFAGVAIPGYGHRIWKVRLASVDMQAGKRGGYRVIYALDQRERSCYLLYIYPKSAQADVTAAEIEKMLNELETFLYGED